MAYYSKEQRALCRRFGVTAQLVSGGDMLGVSVGALRPEWPLHGVRTPPVGGTCGWYVWTGEIDKRDADFFAPMHARHLFEKRPEVSAYLGLPPGWRFLIAPRYEDVWFDESALNQPDD